MVDREARSIAAYLLEQVQQGRVTPAEMDERWPLSSDSALIAIHATLLFLLVDQEPRSIWDAAHGARGTELLQERCVRFLRSDLPYAWPVGEESVLRDLAITSNTPTDDVPLDERRSLASTWPFLPN